MAVAGAVAVAWAGAGAWAVAEAVAATTRRRQHLLLLLLPHLALPCLMRSRKMRNFKMDLTAAVSPSLAAT